MPRRRSPLLLQGRPPQIRAGIGLRKSPDNNEDALLYCDLVEGELKLKPSLLGLDSLAMAFKGQTGVEADKKRV